MYGGGGLSTRRLLCSRLPLPYRSAMPGTMFRCGLALSAGLSEDDRTLGAMEWATSAITSGKRR
eukprot:scaffold23124_cov66-Phaeocystis_antarctica.AAC.1